MVTAILKLPFFLLQAILEEHKEAEVEMIRHRMSRVNHNMPDTLYMVGSQKRSNTAPALFFTAAAAGRLERDKRPSLAQSSNKDDNELDRYVRNRRTSEVISGLLIDILINIFRMLGISLSTHCYFSLILGQKQENVKSLGCQYLKFF